MVLNLDPFVSGDNADPPFGTHRMYPGPGNKDEASDVQVQKTVSWFLYVCIGASCSGSARRRVVGRGAMVGRSARRVGVS